MKKFVQPKVVITKLYQSILTNIPDPSDPTDPITPPTPESSSDNLLEVN